MKNKGILIYIITFFVIGIFSILSTAYAFEHGTIYFSYPIFFIIILGILGKFIKNYENIHKNQL